MTYRFRIFYAGLLGMMILMAGYLYDIRPLLYETKKLAESRQLLNKKLHAIKLSSSSETDFSTERNATRPDLLTLIQDSGLKIKTIKQENENILNVNLSGNFQSLFLFIGKLKEEKISSFSFEADKNNLLIHLRIFMPLRLVKHVEMKTNQDSSKIKKPEVTQKLSDPFCLPHLIVH